MSNEPDTDFLTEAQRTSGVLFVLSATNRTASSVRNVPYAERYSRVSGVYETPVEWLQQATSGDDSL